MKAVVLDPSNGFNMDRTLIKSDVQKLVKVIDSPLVWGYLLSILNTVFVLSIIVFSNVIKEYKVVV